MKKKLSVDYYYYLKNMKNLKRDTIISPVLEPVLEPVFKPFFPYNEFIEPTLPPGFGTLKCVTR